jgi:NADH:ubiquinone oxidoreductase subunit 5 (subunit L)/multisubunit Na+/H+ antiporter MnhA subunit
MCLAGVPLVTNGFFSKDAIMAEVFAAHGPGYQALGVIVLVTAFLTAYYTFRVWFRVCDGPVHFEPGEEHHGEGEFHPHAPRWAINSVLVLITAGAVGSIFCGDWVASLIEGSTAAGGVPGEHGGAEGATVWADPHAWMPWIAGATGIAGIVVAAYLHRRRPEAGPVLDLAAAGHGEQVVRGRAVPPAAAGAAVAGRPHPEPP